MIRARSESYTESDDASYASEVNSNDSSESSSSTATTASAASKSSSGSSSSSKSASSRSSVTSANNPAKCSITRVTVPRKIVIKYSATIESPVLKPPLAIIGHTNSEASDVVESELSESSPEDDDDDDDEVEEDATEQSNDLLETETESETESEEEEDSEEEEEEEESTETGSEESEEVNENSTIQNGFTTNGTKKSKGYDLDDFKILKTIGKWFNVCFSYFTALRKWVYISIR